MEHTMQMLTVLVLMMAAGGGGCAFTLWVRGGLREGG